jgi:tRNA pseudouridine38-40 synthase
MHKDEDLMAETSKNIRLILAYDGSEYHGWQRQQNGITIQAVLEEKIHRITGEPITLFASGRTDAGVHALGQVCNFKTQSKINLSDLKNGLNSLFPEDIFVKDAAYVPDDFHSRYSARSKTYEYRILNKEMPDIFSRRYVWYVRMPLDTKGMSLCLSEIRGMHDFSAFRSTGSGDMNPVRTVLKTELLGPEDGRIRFILEADGFLRHMVRNIVGTVVQVGLGKISVEGFREILESKDRQQAGIKAPPQGLFLVEVKY